MDINGFPLLMDIGEFLEDFATKIEEQKYNSLPKSSRKKKIEIEFDEPANSRTGVISSTIMKHPLKRLNNRPPNQKIQIDDDHTAFFPYVPYLQQEKFVRTVNLGIKDSKNILIESPTGTGKTVSLLSGVLSWQNELKQRDTKPGKLIYTSRTHSQLKQVVRELRKLDYTPRVSMMGSRDQLCINPDLNNYKGELKNFTCDSLGSNCSFRDNGNTKTTLEYNISRGEIYDIEDLVRIGKSHSSCPFFASRKAAKEADVVLLPYNYLLDTNIRENYNEMLNVSVIIFDEAHNVASCAEEGSSLQLSENHLNTALDELELILGIIDRGECKTRKGYDSMLVNEISEIIRVADIKLCSSVVKYLQELYKEKEKHVMGLRERKLNMEDPGEILRFFFKTTDNIPKEQVMENDEDVIMHNALSPENVYDVASKMTQLYESLKVFTRYDSKILRLIFRYL